MKGPLLVLATLTVAAAGQSPVRLCTSNPRPAWCSAVEGDRSEGWLAQTRSEAMGRNGNVLNSSGKAPSEQTLARMNSLGYSWNPKNWGG